MFANMRIKFLFTGLLLLFALAVSAQVVELSVDKIGTTTLSPAKATLFYAPYLTNAQALGSKTTFTYKDVYNPDGKPTQYQVTETYATVKARISALYPSEAVQTKTLLLDATGGKVAGTYSLVDPVTLQAWTLPNKAVVIGGWYDVTTTFTSATDAATIALGINTDFAAGLKAAIAISNGANAYDAGRVAIIPVGTAATHVGPTTADRPVIAVVAVENLTAGVLRLVITYVVRG